MSKNVRVWYAFTLENAHIIVEDEGFKDIEKWNEFNRKCLECLYNRDFENMGNYVSFRTAESDNQDGGNALFAALEYWDGGFVYNDARSGVAMMKRRQQPRHGISTSME